VAVPLEGYNGPIANVAHLAFSPNGSRAVFVLDSKRILIATVSDAALLARRVMADGFDYIGGAAWQKEEQFLFIGRQGDGPKRLWCGDAQTGEVRLVGESALELGENLAVRPDGGAVVVAGGLPEEPRGWSVWLYPLFGGDPAQLTPRGSDAPGQLSWRN